MTCAPLVAKRYKSFQKYEYTYETESLNALNGAINGPKARCKVYMSTLSIFIYFVSYFYFEQNVKFHTYSLLNRLRLRSLAHAASSCAPQSAHWVRRPMLMMEEILSLGRLLVQMLSRLPWRSKFIKALYTEQIRRNWSR